MQYMYGWAKRPMLPRLGRMLDSRVPITLILGQNSWMKRVSDGQCLGEAVSYLRPDSYVDLHYVPDAGHHVHADQPELFCELVNAACALADSDGDRQTKRVAPSGGGRGGERVAPSGGGRGGEKEAPSGPGRGGEREAPSGGRRGGKREPPSGGREGRGEGAPTTHEKRLRDE